MSKGKSQAREIVARQRAEERRRKVTLWTSVTVVLVLVIAGLVGYSVQANQDVGKLTTPTAAVDDGTAFAAGTGGVTVDIYEDFLCPICNTFEQASSPTLKSLADSGKITVRYHPVAILDRLSNGTKFSTRAAAASAAAAQEGKFAEFHQVLFANQPEENTEGLSDARMVELAASVGLTSDAFVDAVNEGTYRAWATRATEKFSERGFTGTPTIVVNGQKLTGPNDTVPTTELLTQTIEKAAG